MLFSQHFLSHFLPTLNNKIGVIFLRGEGVSQPFVWVIVKYAYCGLLLRCPLPSALCATLVILKPLSKTFFCSTDYNIIYVFYSFFLSVKKIYVRSLNLTAVFLLSLAPCEILVFIFSFLFCMSQSQLSKRFVQSLAIFLSSHAICINKCLYFG